MPQPYVSITPSLRSFPRRGDMPYPFLPHKGLDVSSAEVMATLPEYDLSNRRHRIGSRIKDLLRSQWRSMDGFNGGARSEGHRWRPAGILTSDIKGLFAGVPSVDERADVDPKRPTRAQPLVLAARKSDMEPLVERARREGKRAEIVALTYVTGDKYTEPTVYATTLSERMVRGSRVTWSPEESGEKDEYLALAAYSKGKATGVAFGVGVNDAAGGSSTIYPVQTTNLGPGDLDLDVHGHPGPWDLIPVL